MVSFYLGLPLKNSWVINTVKIKNKQGITFEFGIGNFYTITLSIFLFSRQYFKKKKYDSKMEWIT